MADPIREAIVAQLQAIPGMGQVHGYQRYAARENQLAAHYVTNGQLLGWFVRRLSVLEKTEQCADNIEQVRWLIRGYMALDDANASELKFDALLDAMRTAFRVDESLGALVLGGAAISLRANGYSPSQSVNGAEGQAGIAI